MGGVVTSSRLLLLLLVALPTTACAAIAGLKDRELATGDDGGAATDGSAQGDGSAQSDAGATTDAGDAIGSAGDSTAGDAGADSADGGHDAATTDSSADSGGGGADSGDSGGVVDAGPTGVVFVNAASHAGGSPVTITAFDPGTASNRLLVVGVSVAPNGLQAGLSVTFGGVGLLEVSAAAVTANSSGSNPPGYYACTSRIFYLVNPTGAHDVVVTFSGLASPEYAAIGAAAFSNVDQTAPLQNATHATGGATAISLAIATAAGHVSLDNLCDYSATTNIVGGQTTQRWLLSSSVTGAGSTYASTGATTATHLWQQSSGYAWASSGVDIVPAP